MKTIITTPVKKYPYLAVWVGKDASGLTPAEIESLKTEDIYLISMVETSDEADKKPYVQKLFGGKESYYTANENEYVPLPNGVRITINNEF